MSTLNWVLTILAIVLVLLLLFLIIAPRVYPALGVKMGQMAGDAYQRRLLKKLKKQYPLLAERLEGFSMAPENQDAFQHAMRKLPPQEAMKLQAEFNRLRDNFMTKHPEITPLIEAGQDGRAQAKAFDTVMKLPAEQRAALEKDLIWAWDQLRSRFPRLMGTLESAYKKKTPAQ